MNYKATVHYRVRKTGTTGTETFFFCTTGTEVVDAYGFITAELERYCKSTGKEMLALKIETTRETNKCTSFIVGV